MFDFILTTEHLFAKIVIKEHTFHWGDGMRKRFRLKNKRRFFMFLASVFMVLYLFSMIISAGAVSDEPCEYRTVKVQKGDTLWEIASAYCKGDIRENIFKIQQLNQIPQGIIHEGQVLRLP